MGEINESAKTWKTKCANCDHTEFFHLKNTKRDQSRISLSKIYYSECKQCLEEGKTCKNFKEKKSGKILGLFKKVKK